MYVRNYKLNFFVDVFTYKNPYLLYFSCHGVCYREQDQDMQKQEIQSYEERMTNLRQQLSKERDRSYKKTNKEVAEVVFIKSCIYNHRYALFLPQTILKHSVNPVPASDVCLRHQAYI